MGFGLDDIKQVIMNGFKSAFMPFHEKRRYLEAIGAELEAFEPDAGRGPVAVDSGASAASG
jgi:adenosine deaminase